jgi:hypothetical protein
MKKYDIPSDLIKAAKEGKLVLFVGSGVSQNLKNLKGEKLGDWNYMVKLISDIITQKECDNSYAPYLGSIPAKALEEMEKMENLPFDEIHSSLRDHYTVSEVNDFELHRLLSKLSSKIITLNYDNAFEIANNNNIPVAYRGQDYENAEVLKKNRWLFKLHGSISSVGSMVIFPSDYYRLYEKGAEDDLSEQIKFLFEHILVSNTVLFIGTGLSEFQINNTFKKIKKYLDVLSTPHYIITDKKRLSTDLEGIVKPIKIQSFEELKDIIQQMIKNKDEDMPNPIAIQPSETLKNRSSVMGHTNTGKTSISIEEKAKEEKGEFVPFKQDGKYGFLNQHTNTVVIPCKWNNAYPFKNGFARIQNDEGKWGYINNTGTEVIPCEWINAKDFSEELAPVQTHNGKWGYINNKGNMVISCIWKDARLFCEGLACVMDDNSKWGFIDRKGELKTRCLWKKVGDFSEGRAYVMNKQDLYGYINKEGKLVIPCGWEQAESFSKGRTLVFFYKYYHEIDKFGNILSTFSGK